MARLAAIDTYLDDLLAPATFKDVGCNGLQVPGPATVGRVITGVSATRDLIARAVSERADLVLVHHGIFWTFDRGQPSAITLERLRLLMVNEIGLIAHHFPLDAHPVHGNNALLCDALGADSHSGYPLPDGTPLGRVAHFDGGGIDRDELVARTARAVGHDPLVLGDGPARVRRAAVVSGGAADEATRAAALGCELLLTGEPRERTQAEARELGITVLAAGHHATEIGGVRRLGELVADEFGVEHIFVDIPNPV